jgi:ATP-dependent RNA helicase DDX10/DBP4
MFARKNRGILSSHYTKLVDHEDSFFPNHADTNNDEDEDFFSLKRVDHDLPNVSAHSDLSKRKLRLLKSKKALAKAGPQGHKLVFDDEGQAHEVYEFAEWKESTGEEDGKKFMDKEIGRMRQADIHDKEEAKDKKREKKRKRKEREQGEVS